MSIAEQLTLDQMLADDMARFYSDALGFVMYAWDWENDKDLQVVKLPEPWRTKYGCEWGPDQWACEFFERISAAVRKHRFNGSQAVPPILEAIVSGHGIGKSATVGQLVMWIASTRPFSVGSITAGSYKQLQTKTWAQVGKWWRKCITAHWFEYSAAGLWLKHRDNPENWRCDAISCAKENAGSFQGQHAVTSTSYYIFDEASEVPDEIHEAARGGLTDGEPMWFQFGNPIRNTGSFRNVFKGVERKRWQTTHIDSRNVQITNKEYLQSLIDDYGTHSDIVKRRVLGEFPSSSPTQFISQSLVDAARGRVITEEQCAHAAKILTLDPAWSGDDEYVIGLRQGLIFKVIWSGYHIEDDVWLAQKLADLEDIHAADAVFIDFGYGTGVVSVGRSWGRNHWQLVSFGGESNDPAMLNKRGEMWASIKAWLAEGGAIPVDDQVLADDLIAPEYNVKLDGRIVLESKDDMKRRGIASPNRGDALALSFARPVVKKAFRVVGAQAADQQRTFRVGKR